MLSEKSWRVCFQVLAQSRGCSLYCLLSTHWKLCLFVFWVACRCLKMSVSLFPAVTTTLSPGSGHARRCNESEKAYCVNGGDCYYIHGINRLSCKWVSLYWWITLFFNFFLSLSHTLLLITPIPTLFKLKGFYIFALFLTMGTLSPVHMEK